MIIGPRRPWFDLRLGDLWRYRDLVLLLVRRDFVAIYKQTILGPLWFLLQPLLTTLVFTVIFGRIAGLPTDGIPQPLFYLTGVVAWSYFAACLTRTSGTFIDNAALFGKVYFPRLVVPVSVAISCLVAFAIQFLLLISIICYVFWRGGAVGPTPAVLLLPLLVVQMAVLGLGCGIIVSALTTRYRDLTHLVSFGTQLWMFATPVVYPASQIPEGWRWLLLLNPMAAVVESFRGMLLGAGGVTSGQMSISIGLTVILLVAGLTLFNRVEATFSDTV